MSYPGLFVPIDVINLIEKYYNHLSREKWICYIDINRTINNVSITSFIGSLGLAEYYSNSNLKPLNELTDSIINSKDVKYKDFCIAFLAIIKYYESDYKNIKPILEKHLNSKEKIRNIKLSDKINMLYDAIKYTCDEYFSNNNNNKINSVIIFLFNMLPHLKNESNRINYYYEQMRHNNNSKNNNNSSINDNWEDIKNNNSKNNNNSLINNSSINDNWEEVKNNNLSINDSSAVNFLNQLIENNNSATNLVHFVHDAIIICNEKNIKTILCIDKKYLVKLLDKNEPSLYFNIECFDVSFTKKHLCKIMLPISLRDEIHVFEKNKSELLLKIKRKYEGDDCKLIKKKFKADDNSNNNSNDNSNDNSDDNSNDSSKNIKSRILDIVLKLHKNNLLQIKLEVDFYCKNFIDLFNIFQNTNQTYTTFIACVSIFNDRSIDNNHDEILNIFYNEFITNIEACLFIII
jgi:hypothetical protein